jgi:hypothetical protein
MSTLHSDIIADGVPAIKGVFPVTSEAIQDHGVTSPNERKTAASLVSPPKSKRLCLGVGITGDKAGGEDNSYDDDIESCFDDIESVEVECVKTIGVVRNTRESTTLEGPRMKSVANDSDDHGGTTNDDVVVYESEEDDEEEEVNLNHSTNAAGKAGRNTSNGVTAFKSGRIGHGNGGRAFGTRGSEQNEALSTNAAHNAGRNTSNGVTAFESGRIGNGNGVRAFGTRGSEQNEAHVDVGQTIVRAAEVRAGEDVDGGGTIQDYTITTVLFANNNRDVMLQRLISKLCRNDKSCRL